LEEIDEEEDTSNEEDDEEVLERRYTQLHCENSEAYPKSFTGTSVYISLLFVSKESLGEAHVPCTTRLPKVLSGHDPPHC
jgi:hypothetical protein